MILEFFNGHLSMAEIIFSVTSSLLGDSTVQASGPSAIMCEKTPAEL